MAVSMVKNFQIKVKAVFNDNEVVLNEKRNSWIIKKLFISTIVILLALSNVVFAAQSDAEAVESFKQYVRKEIDKAISSYEPNPYRVKGYKVVTSSGHGSSQSIVWRKIYGKVEPKYTIDLEKNNSLISPYIGSLKVSKYYRIYEDCVTKDEAKKNTKVHYEDTTIYEFTLVYQDDQWVVTKLMNNGHNIKVESIYDTLKIK